MGLTSLSVSRPRPSHSEGTRAPPIPHYELRDGPVRGFFGRAFEDYPVFTHLPVSNTGVPHTHPHYELFWITQGEGVALIDFQRVTLRAGTVLFLRPGDVHAWISTAGMQCVLLQFSRDFIGAFESVLPGGFLPCRPGVGAASTLALSPSDAEVINRLVQGLLEESAGARANAELVVRAQLLLLFTKLKQLTEGEWADRPAAVESELTRRFRSAVVTECPRLASVKQFAAHLGVSRSLLHRRVQAETGTSPSDHIHGQLLTNAKRLLLHSTLSVSEISRELGFRDPSYFGRFFRRKTESSPYRFRQELSRRAV